MRIDTQLIRIKYALESLKERDREMIVRKIEILAAEKEFNSKLIDEEGLNETTFYQ